LTQSSGFWFDVVYVDEIVWFHDLDELLTLFIALHNPHSGHLKLTKWRKDIFVFVI
jgi:hypothetical protein